MRKLLIFSGILAWLVCPSLWAETPVLWHLAVSQPILFLTLDDGPYSDPRILDRLCQGDVVGTLFLNGDFVKAHPREVLRLAHAGWDIESHGYHHVSFATLTDAQIHQSLDRTAEAIERLTQQRPRFFRPPYGILNAHIQALCGPNVQAIIQFPVSLSTADFRTDLSLEQKIQRLKTNFRQLRPGDIILSHLGYADSLPLLEVVIDWATDHGFRFGRIREHFAQ